jgi:hypothetical protein
MAYVICDRTVYLDNLHNFTSNVKEARMFDTFDNAHKYFTEHRLDGCALCIVKVKVEY